MTHTKGPWYTANTGNHQGLVVSESNGANVCVTYDKQDASIIAAAPEMLEALSSLLNFSFTSEYDKLIETGCEENVAGHTVSAKLHEIHKMGRAAIAKAEGR